MSSDAATWGDARLAGTRFGHVRWFERIESTNRYLLGSGLPDGTVVVADEQTAGRGRLGRSWLAPPGAALLVSVLLHRPPHHVLTLAAALALIDALPEAGALVKWPNDVVVDDRKLAGILAEADGTGAVVVGMGVNVRADWFPPDLAATAVAVDRAELLVAWLRAYDARLAAPGTVLPDARTRSATLGRHVRVELPREQFEGIARDITDDGHLVVGDRVVSAGDVVHLR